MPRKAVKTGKAPLLFLERTLGGGRVQNVPAPEVRAALNPREFFAENQEHSGTALHSWVSPQFDAAAIAALPVKRGRRGQTGAAASIIGSYSQVSVKKSSVCKFPTLTFASRNQAQPKRTLKRKAPECAGWSDTGKEPLGLRPEKTSSVNDLETPSRKVHSARKRHVASHSDGEASSSRSLDQPGPPATQVTKGPAGSAVTPPPSEWSDPNIACFGPPPDVDTPNVLQESSSDPVHTFFQVFLPEPVTPPGCQQPDILIKDTPERDYGLKVTWRRRTRLMLSLKESGRLSDSDVSVQKWCRQQVE